MKPTPQDTSLLPNLEEGRLTKDGFLGDDGRAVSQIIEEDLALLAANSLTPEQIGQAMRKLARKGMEAQGVPAQAGAYTVVAEEYMGWLGCPFQDNRRAAKRNITVLHRESGKTMVWSDLGIHLIEAHGFFQGKGSLYRLEPLELAEFLGLKKE